jgi:RNA polymerase sigma-70 factor (ECF subfamily)
MDIRQELIDLELELKSDMMMIVSDNDMVCDSYQDAYIKIDGYLKRGREFYGNKASMKALLKMTCRNILLDKLRKKQRERLEFTDNPYPTVDWAMPDDDALEDEMAFNDPEINKTLDSAFNKMNKNAYMTYKLRQKGLKFKDIAYLTDVGINTAIGRMRYAKEAIINEFKLTNQ